MIITQRTPSPEGTEFAVHACCKFATIVNLRFKYVKQV